VATISDKETSEKHKLFSLDLHFVKYTDSQYYNLNVVYLMNHIFYIILSRVI
jgi:hypothetical protein